MMTSPVFVLCLTYLILGKMAQTTALKSVHQGISFVSVKTGDELTLQCFYKGNVPARIYWYKQHLGEKPMLISSYYMFDKNNTFYGEFNNDPRFTLDTENGKNHLKISDLHASDSATYNCVSCYYYVLELTESVTVSVKGSGLKIPALVHQSASESIQPGGSVTLNCTVHTGTCDGEHSVYWFKTSEESHPGLIYTHGGRNDQCERKPNNQTHTCVYNLPMQSLDLSHAGTYYCAVASCGHILFGDGTKLDFKDDEDSLVLVYFLSGALAFNTILVVLLTFFVYFISKRKSCQCRGSNGGVSASSTTNAEAHKNKDNLHYAALRVNKDSRSRRQRDDTQDQCVYSSVK